MRVATFSSFFSTDWTRRAFVASKCATSADNAPIFSFNPPISPCACVFTFANSLVAFSNSPVNHSLCLLSRDFSFHH